MQRVDHLGMNENDPRLRNEGDSRKNAPESGNLSIEREISDDEANAYSLFKALLEMDEFARSQAASQAAGKK